MTADIEASSTYTWNSGSGFSPIGNSTTHFSGSFHGAGHAINHLYINYPTNNYVGLFGYTDTLTVIDSLGIAGGSVQGNNYVGAMVGYRYYGQTIHCFTSDTITANGSIGGGLIGYAKGGSTIGCYATGNVRVANTGGDAYSGGLMGYCTNDSCISCYASGMVDVTSGEDFTSYAGGLMALHSGSITECYATGSVKTETVDPYSLNIVGGLVGEGGNIRNCYATCIVIGGAPSNELGSNGVGCLVGAISITVMRQVLLRYLIR